MKKEPCWDLSINTEAGDAPKSTPRKRAAKGTTPKKGMKMEGSGVSDDEEDTPSKKKSVLKKVQSGRVAKPSSRAKSVKNYAESEDENDDMAVKDEADELTFDNSSNGGNGYEQHAGNGSR